VFISNVSVIEQTAQQCLGNVYPGRLVSKGVCMVLGKIVPFPHSCLLSRTRARDVLSSKLSPRMMTAPHKWATTVAPTNNLVRTTLLCSEKGETLSLRRRNLPPRVLLLARSDPINGEVQLRYLAALARTRSWLFGDGQCCP
jgi:hypothetical protein